MSRAAITPSLVFQQKHTANRIHTPQTAITHYVSEFSLSAKSGPHSEAFSTAKDILLDWAKRKSRRTVDYAERHESMGGDAEAPEIWAFHIQHRDQQEDYRRWFIDASFQRRVDGFDVRISISYALDYTFVGWAPKPPDPAAPNFIFDWLGHNNLNLRSGQFPIAVLTPVALPMQSGKPKTIKERVGAMTVTPENADKLARLIFDSNRSLPVLVINGEVNPITFPLAPHNLQQLLFGTCYVVWAPPAPGWGRAWREHFPKGFDCRPNSVRLYQPGASSTTPHDSVRHRFFTDDEIHQHGGSEAFITMIRDGLTRRLLAPRMGRVATCEEVLSLRASEDFTQQRARLSSKDDELALYETEYKRLLESKQLTEQLLQESDAELGRIRSAYDALRPHAQSLVTQLEAAKNSASPVFDQSHLLLRFFKNEASVADQLRAIQAIYSDAVHLLQSALNSAEDASDFEHPDILRDMLIKLATDFYQCLRQGRGTQEGVRIFGRNDFTTKESDNLSHKGRLARTFSYKGQSICMEQHLKIGVKDSEAHCLRVHFHWDSEAHKIVIGHCGKHLPL